MARFKRCCIHIGTEKTGTTSVQRLLSQNRGLMLDHGFLYPRTFGNENHTKLAVHAMDDGRRDGMKTDLGLDASESIPAFRQELAEAFGQEVAKVGSSRAHTLVLSNEHLHSRIIHTGEIERLRDLLAPHVDDFTVLVYVRRQDQLAISSHSTRIKAGSTEFGNILPQFGDELPRFYDYKALIDNYASVFGYDNITVRIFDRAYFPKGDLLADFCHSAGITIYDAMTVPEMQNESLTPHAQMLLAELNKRIRRRSGDQQVDVRWREMRRLVVRLFSGKGLTLKRSDAEAFYAAFRDGNEAIRQRYFPKLDRLFDEDFSIYPEGAPIYDMSTSDVLDMAADLLTMSADEICRSRAAIAVRDGDVHALKGNQKAAQRCYSRAARQYPDLPEVEERLAALASGAHPSDTERGRSAAHREAPHRPAPRKWLW